MLTCTVCHPHTDLSIPDNRFFIVGATSSQTTEEKQVDQTSFTAVRLLMLFITRTACTNLMNEPTMSVCMESVECVFT